VISHKSRPGVIAAGAAVVFLVSGSIALASIPNHNGVYTGCYSKHTGALRVVKSAAACKGSEKAITWSKQGKKGAKGARGQAGTPGAPGANGNTILSGTGAPAAATGSNGDFYLDTDASTLYGPKAAGAWPGSGTSLIGPPGQDAGSIIHVTHQWSNGSDEGGTSSVGNGFMGTNTATLTCPADHPIALNISTSDDSGVPDSSSATATYGRSSADVTEHGVTIGAPFTVTVTLPCLGE
jgi:hypothetical protein